MALNKTSSNPVFARSEPLAAALRNGVPGNPAGAFGTGKMTLDDITVKTGILLGLIMVTGTGAWVLNAGLGVVMIAGLVGFGLAIVNIFKKQVSPPLILAYAAIEGVFLGGISHYYATEFGGGIVPQAVIATVAVFSAVLFGYKSGRLRATPKFRKIVTLSFLALFGLVLVNFMASLFTGGGDPLGIRGGNIGLSVLVSLGLIVFGALTFVLDFDRADEMIAAGVDERESWRVAFGLIVGIVFLYLEILRLLSYFNGRD